MADEQLYDILIPPGVPRSIISDVLGKFDVGITTRKERLKFANMDGDVRELLAFRGKRETIEQVEKYMLQQLNEFISK